MATVVELLEKIAANQVTQIQLMRDCVCDSLELLVAGVQEIVSILKGPTVVGIVIVPGQPTFQTSRKELDMHVSIIKKSAMKKGLTPKATGPVADFVLIDNQDDTCTVQGQDAAGNPVDISAVATIAVTSSDPTIVKVDPPTGMTFAMHATGKLSVPGTPVNIMATATWNDGSIGPFSFTLPVDVKAGPAGGIVIVPGTPTSH